MADDRTHGYNAGHRRPPATQGGDDPLAELARLIGQQNEAAPSYPQNDGGYGAQAASGWSQPASYDAPQVAAPSHYAPSYADPAHVHGAYGNGSHDPRYDGVAPQDSGYGSAPYVPAYADQHDPRYEDARYGDARQSDARYGEQYSDPSYAQPQYADQRYADQGYADPRYAEQGYSDQGYADPRQAGAPYGDPRYASDPRYGERAYSDPRYSDPRYGGDAAANGYADPRYPEPNFGGQPQYGAPSHAPMPGGYPQAPHGHPGYGYQDGGHPYANSQYGAPPVAATVRAADERQPAQRRGNIVTVLAVLALAVVGTASAFGYRAMFGGAGTPVPPPVITADTKPSKVVPATDPSAKPIQDRIGVKTEKIVPRQEEPVQQATPGQPRQIAPWLPAQNPQNFPPASANVSPPTGSTGAAASQGQPTAAPKRIKTVPIKPEADAGPAARNTRTASATPAHADDPIAAQISGAPLALSPTGSVPASAQRHGAPPTVTASLPQGTGSAAFPAPISSGGSRAPVASANPASGPYAVQVTSQRSESDAQSSFRSLQQQFPSVLGNRQPVIRRADLGEKGTYYRAQIPFQSQSEANDFCTSLKAAGGQCVIARN
jgi:hypothetical protein